MTSFRSANIFPIILLSTFLYGTVLSGLSSSWFPYLPPPWMNSAESQEVEKLSDIKTQASSPKIPSVGILENASSVQDKVLASGTDSDQIKGQTDVKPSSLVTKDHSKPIVPIGLHDVANWRPSGGLTWNWAKVLAAKNPRNYQIVTAVPLASPEMDVQMWPKIVAKVNRKSRARKHGINTLERKHNRRSHSKEAEVSKENARKDRRKKLPRTRDPLCYFTAIACRD
ncbi:hypothetical protein DdX_09127 [Ditylenchus destructor]|uniref:Uncharacterized protein n=1 Tax=Ditylenchus destructor TaxID=166010 RepID=A0AAD4N2S0_9BILA|nr:hypothetical protein DdX_09127 [Ditylenchus destructor]